MPTRLLSILVKPRSKKPSVTEQPGRRLIVTVHEAPTDGKANDAVVKAIAKHFDIPPSSVCIVRGFKSRDKVIRVER
ncbi:MAG: DUF167 domain-containing protein [Candidatus Kerfeldbacteria bacterium]|nr:DUF167 domain-containing protein [Candidatus Kerfeldbacteria bacterium]